MRDLTVEEKIIFEKWIISNVTTAVVPDDEGNEEGLIYNLVHCLRGNSLRYCYMKDQDVEVQTWRRDLGIVE